MKFEPKTAKNVNMLYQTLTSLRNPQTQSKEEKYLSMPDSLTLEEKGFLDFFSNLSFTAHHSTPAADLPEIVQSGALMSLKERESKDEPIHNSHTGGAARQNFVYCTLGVDGKFISPGFIGNDKQKVTFTLPLKFSDQKDQKNSCFQQVISALSISNHDSWFYHEARTDPIKINDVTRHIQFTKTDKFYIYHNQKTGEIWQRKVARQEELFFVQNDFAEISHVLGLQFLIELYNFKGDFCEKILKDPHQHQSIITSVFRQLFPSEIYPEIQIKGKIPLETFPGLVIHYPDNQIDQLIAIADALSEQTPSEILPLINESLPLDASIETQYVDANNLVALATHIGQDDIILHLVKLGARLQVVSLNNPHNILTISLSRSESLGKYHPFAQNYPWLRQCLVGFSQQTMPEVTQQFDLSRIINHKYPAIVILLILCWPNPKDRQNIAKYKVKILAYLTAQIKIYDPWVGLISSVYHYIYQEFQNKEKLLPLMDWLLEQKCNINLAGKATKKSLWELAKENKDSAVKVWAEKNGAVPVFTKNMTFTPSNCAVGGVVFTQYKGEMRVLLVEKPHYWCGPGGLVEPEETTFQALLREIKEETSLDLFKSKFESTARYRFQVEKDHYLRELYYLKLHATELPWVKAEDDVADVQWVPIRDLDFKASPVLYNGKPILTSNSLLIQAMTSGIPEESRIETALYYESKYGKKEFEHELARGDLPMINYVIPKGVILPETDAIEIAVLLRNKMMIEKLLTVSGSKFNTIDSNHIALKQAYEVNRKFVFYLIEHHQAEWRTVEPSFILSVLFKADFPLIKYLISRQEKLSSTFFNYCTNKFINFNNLDLLKLLLSYYPEQSTRQFGIEDNLITAASVSLPVFEFLFVNGKAEISKNLFKKLNQMKMMEDARRDAYLNFPSMFGDSLPIEKSSSIYLVMEYIDKLLTGPLKKKESEIKSYKIRLIPPPSSSVSTTQNPLTLTPQF